MAGPDPAVRPDTVASAHPRGRARTPPGGVNVWGDPWTRTPSDPLAGQQVTPAAMRSMMTDLQLGQLSRTQAILGRMQWLLSHYLAGDSAEVTSTALSMLCPTDRDSLAGTVKVMFDAQERVSRMITNVLGADTARASQPPSAEKPAEAPSGLDLSPEAIARMPVEVLAAFQRVIEWTEGATVKRELPMPPEPLP